jgi:hypothetical protein
MYEDNYWNRRAAGRHHEATSKTCTFDLELGFGDIEPDTFAEAAIEGDGAAHTIEGHLDAIRPSCPAHCADPPAVRRRR